MLLNVLCCEEFIHVKYEIFEGVLVKFGNFHRLKILAVVRIKIEPLDFLGIYYRMLESMI